MARWLLLLLLVGCVVGDEGDLPAGMDDDEIDTAFTGEPALTWPRLAKGDTNQDVTTAQYLLAAAGGSVPKTGSFDAATDRAVRDFQRARSLSVDGIIGAETWQKLIVTLRTNDRGPAVEALQYLLLRRYGQSLAITGTFGPTTSSVLEAFQRSQCLEATGTVGRYTWNALVARRSFCASPTRSAAARVLAAHQAGRLTLWNETFGRRDGADPLSNITAAAAGTAAKTSCYGGAPCTAVRLTDPLVAGMAALREERNFDYFVTAIAGASHSAGSLHYQGRAFDLDEVNGVKIQGDSALARSFMAACRELGAIEVLGPSNDAGHQDHIHCGW